MPLPKPKLSETPLADLALNMHLQGAPFAAIYQALREAEIGPRRNHAAEFDQFWKAYPNRVGKGAAEKAFHKARKAASLEVLLDGLHRYAAKRDDRPWCNPATWLNQTRWLDEEPAPVGAVKGAGLFFQSAQGDLDELQGTGSGESHRGPSLERLPLFAGADHPGHR
jgi:hypothetical protein